MKTLVGWFDHRLGIKDFFDKHLAYPLTVDANFWTLFGGLTIGCIFIQFVTGFYMLWFYIPEPVLAHESIKAMANETSIGALFRNVHRYSSTVGGLFILIHFTHVMARRAYLPPRELNWWTGLALGFLFILLIITGIIMPWDWRSYWELIIWADWMDTVPLVGDYMKGPMLKYFSVGKNFALHIYLLPALIVGLIAVHIILFRRFGMSGKV